MSSVPDSTGVMRWDFFVPDTDADKRERSCEGYPLFPTDLGISLEAWGRSWGGS